MSYATFHWRMFNISMRVVGIGWLIGGFGFVWASIQEYLNPLPTTGNFFVSPTVDSAVIGIVVCLSAVLMLRAGPYRPDLPPASGTVKWWTGDRMEDGKGAA